MNQNKEKSSDAPNDNHGVRGDSRMSTAWTRPTKYIVGVGLVLLGIFVLYLSRSIIPLLIIAALIAVIVRPAIVWLHEGFGLPRGVAVAIMYLILVVLVPLALVLVVPMIVSALEYVLSLDYASLLQRGTAWLRDTLTGLKEAQLPVPALDAYVDQTADTLLAALQDATPTEAQAPSASTILQSLGAALTTTFGAAASLIGSVFTSLLLFIFIFLASIYISLKAHTYPEAFLRLAPPAYRAEMAILLRRIMRLWNSFFRGQITLMLVIGVISWLGLSLLGVPGALGLGIIAGLLELIPNLGPIIATIPAVIVALLQGSTSLAVSPLVLALLVLLFYVLLQQLENSVIVPRVLGDAVDLPPLVVMTGVLVGGTTAGILGALLATPVIGTGREIVRYLYRKILEQDPFPPEEQPKLVKAPRVGLLQRLRAWRLRTSTAVTQRPVPSTASEDVADPPAEGENNKD
ncbi:MAG TPA: AI-2E family transporter [Anaerolineales bacterium]|nr:AI-2E family transporter [Anaerolineales bacterium]